MMKYRLRFEGMNRGRLRGQFCRRREGRRRRKSLGGRRRRGGGERFGSFSSFSFLWRGRGGQRKRRRTLRLELREK